MARPAEHQQNQAGLTVEHVGSDSVDGQPATEIPRAPRPTRKPAAFDYWIGANGLPLQLLHSGAATGRAYTMLLMYSRFDDPAISIDAPP